MSDYPDFMRWVANERKRAGLTSEAYQAKAIQRWWTETQTKTLTLEDIQKGYRHFLRDSYWRSKGCPLGGFITQWEEMVERAGDETHADPQAARGWSGSRLQALQNGIEDLKLEILARERNLAQKHCICGSKNKPPGDIRIGCGYCVVQHYGAEACLERLEQLKKELLDVEMEFARLQKRRHLEAVT